MDISNINTKIKIKKILVRRVDNLGDIVLFIPVLREIRNYFEKAEIYLMVKPEHQGLFYKYADNFLDPKPYVELRKLWQKYDLTINVEYALPKNYKPGSFKAKKLIHIGVVDWQKKQHIYKHLLEGVAAHGIPVTYKKPRVFISPESRKDSREWLNINQIKDSSFNVALNPGSNFSEKIWPISKYSEVCKWLINNLDSNILIVGKEHNSLKLCKVLNNARVKLLHNSPIEFVAGVINNYDLFIGNDSGTSHLASALGLPTVTIFGPTAPGLWKPAGKRSIIVRNNNLSFNSKTKSTSKANNTSMAKITVNDVIDAIILSLIKYFGLGSRPCFDKIRVSSSLSFKESSNGLIITEKNSLHSCLVNNGWNYIAKVLDEVNKTNSFNKTIKKFAEARQLIEFFMLHRVVSPVI